MNILVTLNSGYVLPLCTMLKSLSYSNEGTDINLVRFFAITTIARIPSIITSTICGNELMHNNMKTAATVFVLTAVLSGICAIIYKKHNDKKIKAA